MGEIHRPRSALWSVSTAAQRTNERAAGIAGANPFEMAGWYRAGIFELRVVSTRNLALTAVRIYGSLNGDTFADNALPGEELVSVAFAVPLAGVSVLRAPRLLAGAGLAVAPAFLPPFLMLEYSTGIAGLTPDLTFEIHGAFFDNISVVPR